MASLAGLVSLVASATAVSAATLTNYWPINSSTASTSGGLVDTIGGKTATQVGNTNASTDPTTFITNFYSQPLEAARVYSVGTNTGNGSGGYVSSLTQLPASFTYETVFQWNNNGYNWSYFTGRGSGPLEIAFRNPTSNASSYWTIRDPVNNNASLGNFTYPNFSSGAWYHLAMTYDGATAKLYLTPIQGATQVTLLASAAAAGKIASSTTGLSFGITDSSQYGMGTRVDWAAVYDGALSAAELFTDLQQNAPVSGVPEPALAGILVGGCVAGYLGWRRPRSHSRATETK